MTSRNNQSDLSQSGNVFVIIMLGVVLFAALMFTFSRSVRQGGENISQKQIELSVSDILTYAQKLERATGRVMMGGRYSESQIDFNNVIVAGYANGGCGADTKCKIFNSDGGAAAWESPPPGFSTGNWIITGENAVPDIGDDARADLLLLLPGLDSTKCSIINKTLGLSVSLPEDADGIVKTLFAGTFNNTGRIGQNADLSHVRAACVVNTAPNPDEYVFYYVLMDR